MDNPVNLRPVQSGDLPVFFAHRRDPAARAMAAFGSGDPDDWAGFEAKWLGLLADAGIVARTIEVGGVAAGYVGHHPQCGVPSISYWLGREFWGRGLAKRAVAQFLAMIAVRPLYARVAWDNAASLRVLAHCGFQSVGTDRGFAHGRGEDVDEIILALSL